MSEGILQINPLIPIRDPNQIGSPLVVEAPIGLGIGLVLANMLKNKNQKKLPTKKKTKKSNQEPPEDPNLLPEITSEILNKELEDKAEYKFQYMANKEGGQTLGNREIIVNLDEDLFNKYLKNKTTFKNFKEYRENNPNDSIKLFKRANQKEYQVTDVGQVGEDISFTPEMQDNPYRIQVENFNSKRAIKQAKTFDSDVFPMKAEGGMIDKPLQGNNRYL
tara:strand:+ start:39 stop:698 length:660 start_codon:yes stop_codon:yes gene_type:complete